MATQVSKKGIAEIQKDFVESRATLYELEVELEFWLDTEDCEFCDHQMCSAHYHVFWATL